MRKGAFAEAISGYTVIELILVIAMIAVVVMIMAWITGTLKW